VKQLALPVILSLLLLILLLPLTARSQQPAGVDPAERTAIIAIVQQLFDAIGSRDPGLAEPILMPEGRFVSVREEDGNPVVRSISHEQFLRELPQGKEKMLERMWDQEVRVHGSIATVWTPYDFYREGKFSHCGIDAVSLVKMSGRWVIAGVVYTVERTGCPPSPLGPPKF
jgi:hypothetical protein